MQSTLYVLTNVSVYVSVLTKFIIHNLNNFLFELKSNE